MAARFCHVRHAAVESAVCCVLPWGREPGAAVFAGADDYFTAGVASTSPNSWVVKTSKRLSYELRHNTNRNLGRLNDAQFEYLPMLQAFQWSPVKILAFLLSNSKSRFGIHLQLRELMYERVEHWDIYISLSAFQGHTRYSDIASEESFGKKLSMSDLMSLGKVFHCTKNHNWDSINADGLRLSATRGGQSRS